MEAKIVNKIELSDQTARLLYQLAEKFYQDDPEREKTFQERIKQQRSNEMNSISIKLNESIAKTFGEVSMEVLSIIQNNGLDHFPGIVRDIFNYILQIIDESI